MSRTAKGLTLLELLVVIVLVSLLSTLVIQGVGFYLGKYQIVRRVQHEASLGLLHQRWFASTVRGMVPHRLERLRFAGDGAAFEGFTLQPLAAEPGMPMNVRWSITADSNSQTVAYSEEGNVEWKVLKLEGADLSFQYADVNASWHDSWPVSGLDGKTIPHMIRLRSAREQTLWLVHLGLFPEPVQNSRDFS